MNNRIIRFRAFDKRPERREMIYGIQDSSGMRGPSFGEYLAYPDTYEVMQFTGLVDKNGKDIWEGDILKYDTGHKFENERYAALLLSEIFWDTYRWRISYSTGYYDWTKIEVLGNVFENPELLNK